MSDDADCGECERKPVAGTRLNQPRHELATGRARALSAAGTHGLRRRLRPALAGGHGERRPLLRPALLENRAMRGAGGAQSLL
jgi:hypothetical protein